MLYDNRVNFKDILIKKMDCLSEPGITNGLGFEVKPEIKGLAGLCHHRKPLCMKKALRVRRNFLS